MNARFNYQSDWFLPVLAVSFAAHAVFFGASGFLEFSPKYAVKQAPASVEMVMLEEKKELIKPQDNILTVKENPAVQEKVVQKKKEEEAVRKTLITPQIKGAISEAKPDYLQNPAPVYPELARREGWEGLVLLRVSVSPEGEVTEVQIEQSSGYGVLDGAALEAVKKWKFLPARIGNIYFSSQVKIPVRFILEENTI